MYWFKRKWRQIKRVWDFLPIIWNGYDFDYRYAVELFQHQLSRTADFLESDRAYSINAHQDARRIRTAVELLEKVYDEDYALEYYTKIEEKYGKSSFDFVETGERDSKGDPYYKMVENFEKDYTDSELLIIAEEKHAEMLESRAKQARAHKLVWNFIEHNIQKWWD